MYSKNDICEKIHSFFPDVGQCGSDILIDFEADMDVWSIDLKNRHKHLKTYVEKEDMDACLLNGKCIGLGIQVAQLRDNSGHA